MSKMQFFKQFIALVVPFLSLCVNAQGSPSTLVEVQKSEPVVKFDYRAKGKFYSNANGSTSEGVIIQWSADYQKTLMQNLRLSFNGGVYFESDRTQDFFVDSDSGNRLNLNHAMIEWTPNNNILLQAGALDQNSTFERDLLLGSGTFPAALQTFDFNYKNLNYGLTLEQAIPTSRTYSTKAVESEPTPTLFFEELFLDYKISKYSNFKLNLGYFAFYDLPSQVAEDSSVHGNLVGRLGPNDSYFIYPFQGWSVTSSYNNRFMKEFGFSIKYEFVSNVKAPVNVAQANALSFNLDQYRAFSQTTYEVLFFEQEQHAAPSYYLDDLFGYSNRFGWGLGAKHKFNKSDFYIGFEWVESQIIEITPEQADQRTIQIYLGVDNA